MNNPTSHAESSQTSTRFPSFSALRIAHRELLHQYNEISDQQSLVPTIQAFILQGKQTGAIIDGVDDRLAAQGLLDYWGSVLLRSSQVPMDTGLADFDIALAPMLADEDCPYLGLDAFQEKDAEVFHGRQRMIAQLLTALESNRLLAVLGSSGSGKSSVVMGGLIPRLKAGGLDESDRWHYFSPMVPGNTPFKNLLQVLDPEAKPNTDRIEQLRRQLLAKPSDLPNLIQQRVHDQTSVLVIDQFEELFTLCSEDSRQAFIQGLMALLQNSTLPPIYVILTMRSDFESKVAMLPNFYHFFAVAQVRVLPLDASDLREAIQKPAEKVGLKFEEGIVEKLVADVLGEPAALPLLQFVLLKLWERREHNLVTYQTYQMLGGAREALAYSADEFYRQLIPEDQVTAQRILLRMIQVGQGLEVTSRRILKTELYRGQEDRDRINRVLDKLLKAKLVRISRGSTVETTQIETTQIEIAHEALIRNWPQFIDWIEDTRIDLRRRHSLTIAAEQWQERKRDPNVLLRGGLLEEAQNYSDLSEIERQFVQRSKRSAQKKSIRQIGVTLFIFVLLLIWPLTALFILQNIRVEQAKQEFKELAQDYKELAEREEDARKEAEKALRSLEQFKADLNLINNGQQSKVLGPKGFLRNVRAGYGTKFDILYKLTGLTPVQILETQRDSGGYPWYKIKVLNNSKLKEGWIAAHLVQSQ